jgi:hypothetical protein
MGFAVGACTLILGDVLADSPADFLLEHDVISSSEWNMM